ncbi:hypothetical protein WL77_22230 [Burkholderia ubonensis]|uniref:hypothetical protein n=1 Tax=Burkholderia ubonensis TaxID=101571 RepID=UPI00075DA256|nr:hypothetical protein [Burkholderia ubonensis]KWE63698.1 hypothetical protein WL77_22230 [Burkholderia ubonensis]KWE74357.1 hypothetical protein WL79_14155 [Burkholderia ubonensis]
MNGWVVALAGVVILYMLLRMLRRPRALRATEAAKSALDDTPPPSLPAESKQTLADQPDVASIDRVVVNATVDVAALRRDMTALLVECGALDPRVRDENERFLPESQNLVISVPLRAIPSALIARLWDNPVDNLQFSAHVTWRNRGYIHGAYGNIAALEQAFDAWLDAAPGWHDVGQERGSYIAGAFFTDEVVLHMERGYLDSSVAIDVVSRDVLTRDVRRQLAELRAHLDNRRAADANRRDP